MSRVIASSMSIEPVLQAGINDNVMANLVWSAANASACCHLKCVVRHQLAGVVLVKQFWNLCSLFVAPELQRQGIGRGLLLAAAQACRTRSEKGAIWLNAAPGAIPFYRAMGFVARTSAQTVPQGFVPMALAL